MDTQLAAAETPAPKVQLHPNAAALYAAKVADLQASLNDETIRAQAADVLSGLIETVVLTPEETAPDGLRAELHGDLAMILSLAMQAETGIKSSRLPRTKNPRSRSVPEGLLSLVAGARFERATFRL